GRPVRPDGVDDRIQVGAAGNALGDVFATYELGGTVETGRCRQVGVDRPAAPEPAELIVGAFDGRVSVGVPATRPQPDHPLAAGHIGGLPGGVPCVDEFLVGLYGDQV